jgi:hypothetical protein
MEGVIYMHSYCEYIFLNLSNGLHTDTVTTA